MITNEKSCKGTDLNVNVYTDKGEVEIQSRFVFCAQIVLSTEVVLALCSNCAKHRIKLCYVLQLCQIRRQFESQVTIASVTTQIVFRAVICISSV